MAQIDAAPLIVAQELGFFREQGLCVDLRREIGWASIQDKVVYGELDAAHAPAPLLWSVHLGLGSPRKEVLTALALGRHPGALILSRSLYDSASTETASLQDYLRTLGSSRRLTFGVPFSFSTSHVRLRAWLRAAGFAPDHEARIVVVPSSQMLRHLSAGILDGCCAEEPWGALAVRAGTGRYAPLDAVRTPELVDKVLMVTRRFAEEKPDSHAALVRAISAAARWCDAPANRETLAALLAGQSFLNQPADLIGSSQWPTLDRKPGASDPIPGPTQGGHQDPLVPTMEAGFALQDAMGEAGILSPFHAAQRDLPQRVFREDLHRALLSDAGEQVRSSG